MTSQNRQEKIQSILSRRHKDITVVLEDIHDPHNASAIFRTCDAFGIDDIKLIFDKEQGFDPKVVGKSSSSSANKWLNFETFSSSRDCLDKLKSQGYTIFVSALDKNAKQISEVNFADYQKVALVVGNEHSGVSPTTSDMANEIVYIPMQGFVQSLNVSVASAIFIYEITKQKH